MISGTQAEVLARRFLEKQGLVFIEANFRLRIGEIDLIMLDQDILVFVEVKYRSSNTFGSPLEQVTFAKQRKIKLVAGVYLQRQATLPVTRFDVVGITPKGSNYRYCWVKGAFE